ncbi:MAG TPA: ABC transporter substrate-binding protein [Salinarimonas sp.]|jgi:peptide/nickel transport system substrate-binding protein|nr:ABC transporter substrate-binding protein [Salinarimonas sp.]
MRSVRLTVLLAGLLAAPVGASAQTLTIASKADIRGTNPGVNRDGETDAVAFHMVEGLVAYQEGGTVGPMLAEAVELSSDGRTYTFRLRKGVKFHNGAEMTSADVLWSWNRYMDPKTDWRCRSEFDGRSGIKVEAVEAPDPHTVTMRIDRPQSLFLDSLARPDCGMTGILHRDSVNPDGSWKAPVGTGPFRFGEWRRGQSVTLLRFDDYAALPGKPDGLTGGKRPLVREVRFLVVPDPSTVKAGLQSGSLDAAEVPDSDLAELSKDSRVKLHIGSTAARHAVLFQTTDPLFKSAKMRQAIAAALDVNEIVAIASDGRAKANGSTINMRSPYYSAVQARGAKHDPALARKLLAEAGYKGERIRITTNNRKSVPSFNIAVVIQAMLQNVGVAADLEVVEWATHMDRFLKGNYQVMVHSYSSRLDPALSFEHFMGPKDKQPRKVWDDPEAQALLEKATAISDAEERQKIFDRLHERMLDDMPLLILFNPIDAWATTRRVEGFTPWEGSARAWETSVRP